MGREGRSSITWWKWKDGLELASQALLRYPALSAAAGPPCQSPTAAPSPPRCIRHRRRFGGDARHAPQAGLRAHLVAESLCALTKNREASIVLASLFLAGAEGLEPSARGFGVDVEKRKRERGKGGVAQFFRTSLNREVLVWCCGIIQCPEMGRNGRKTAESHHIH